MEEGKSVLSGSREPSMTSLIVWNISKALENNPSIDLRTAINNVQEQLNGDCCNFNRIIALQPEERHLACALLAWQELGHTNADSLYEFVEARTRVRESNEKSCNLPECSLNICAKEAKCPIGEKYTGFIDNAECEYINGENATYCYKKTPNKDEVADIKNSTSSQTKTEGNSQYSHDSVKDLKDNTDKTTNTNVKKVACPYDYIMTPRKDNSDKSTYSTVKKAVCPYDYIMTPRKDNSDNTTNSNVKKYDYIMTPRNQVSDMTDTKSDNFDASSFNGPVVKLPTETKIIMRSENVHNVCRPKRTSKSDDKNIMGKIDAACCMESACTERLVELDRTITELRTRADQLARREAERVELIERAESAWKDLELGYQRRLRLAQEKEEDMVTQLQKLIEDRNNYKEACMKLTTSLKEKGEIAEKNRVKLMEIEKEICENASVRLLLSEEFTRGDAALAEHHIKAAQLDRDLQFKEDQARRKSSSIESEVEAVRALAYEAERAMRSELCSLKEQIKQLSEQLLSEDSDNCKIKIELQDLQEEKSGMIEDLGNCQVMCDGHIQGKLDELKKKREQLSQLKSKVIDCKCKLPVDEAVEVKRTPSLATLCKCVPEDSILDQCSCTSLRSQLLTNLFADLFGGLQDELGGSGALMPCQLLKCLEDKHNWDRSSIVKTNLRDFFSQLLLGELDIAIATSIEKYHATWIGATCAEAMKSKDACENNKEECAIEHRARKLANKLAEQLFKERADQVIQRAKDLINSGSPPCDCKQQTAAVFPCLVKQPTISGRGPASTSTSHSYWRKTSQDVTQIKAQIDDLKKDTIKKEDLINMEDKITKLFQYSLVPEITSDTAPNIENTTIVEESKRNENKNHRYLNTERTKQPLGQKLSSIKKKLEPSSKKTTKNPLNVTQVDKSNKLYKKLGHTYAVNMCLCGSQKESTKPAKNEISSDIPLIEHEYKTSWKQQNSKVPQITGSIKQTKPINVQMPSINITQKKLPTPCKSNCTCFHKIPSNSSINKLLDFLAKWNYDFKEFGNEQNFPNLIKTSLSKTSKSNTNPKNISGFDSVNSNGQNQSKNSGIEKVLPTTESEYIGAVNLDIVKSDYYVYNSTKDIKNNSKKEDAIPDSILHFDCSDANCKKLLENKEGKINGNRFFKRHSIQNKNNLSVNQLLLQQNITEKTSRNSAITKNKSNLPQNRKENNIDKYKQKSNDSKVNVLDSGMDHIVNNPEIFPDDCDYFIKFLGVTLTNTNSDKILDKNNDDYYRTKIKYCNKDQNEHTLKDVEQPINNSKIIYGHKNDILGAPTISNMATCQREVISEELKKNKCKWYRRCEKLCENDDKALDFTQENCIYRKNVHALEESKDLEVNTFNLLEDHLKQRLQKFKSFCCKSSCISPDEEEKMFSALLLKVKQVISESANKITCTCTRKDETDSSWNRAHILLQEYLKTKMKRVHCLCVATEESKQDYILPNVLEKVYNLIEDDFQRLKAICKCHCIDTPIIRNVRDQKYVPEKDNNSMDDNLQHLRTKKMPNGELTTSSIEKLCKSSSNQSIIHTQNISAQVAYNLGMETKSCDAMEKGNKNIQTAESVKMVSSIYCNYFKSDCDCGCNLNTRTDEILSNPCTNDIPKCLLDSKILNYPVLCEVNCDNLSEQQQNVFIDSDERIQTYQETPTSDKDDETPFPSQLTSPYVGCTINCSCSRSLGIDACVKSTVQNNEQIKNIINDMKTKIQMQNISYIMDSVPKTSKTKYVKNNKRSINDIDNKVPSVKNVRDSKVSVHNEEEIFLKRSNINLNCSCNTTNTSDQMTGLVNDAAFVPLNKNTIAGYKSKTLEEINKRDRDREHRSILKDNCVKSEPFLNSTVKQFNTLGCDCSLVPVCHVKMLVENIENKLMQSKCTCDSLNPKICPVHSSKY